MKKTLYALMMATALVSPTAAMAREITIATTVGDYYGPNAFLAIYLTKPNGAYDSTIWVAGYKSRYYRTLSSWYRGISQSGGNIDGITGASVGPGQTLTLKTNLSDAMINAGYKLHVDSSVEHVGEYPNDVVVPLAKSENNKAVPGTGFVADVKISM